MVIEGVRKRGNDQIHVQLAVSLLAFLAESMVENLCSSLASITSQEPVCALWCPDQSRAQLPSPLNIVNTDVN